MSDMVIRVLNALRGEGIQVSLTARMLLLADWGGGVFCAQHTSVRLDFS